MKLKRVKKPIPSLILFLFFALIFDLFKSSFQYSRIFFSDKLCSASCFIFAVPDIIFFLSSFWHFSQFLPFLFRLSQTILQSVTQKSSFLCVDAERSLVGDCCLSQLCVLDYRRILGNYSETDAATMKSPIL